MRINNLIRGKGLRQKEVALAIGMSQQLFSAKMNDKFDFTLKDLAAHADFLHGSEDYLMGRSDSDGGSE